MTMLPEQTSAVILAAGGGLRLGGTPKAFLRLNNRTLLEIVAETVAPFCAEIIIGLRPQDILTGEAMRQSGQLPSMAVIYPGGESRQETAMTLIDKATRPVILLHEVARPFVSAETIAAVLTAGAESGAASLYLPLSIRDCVGQMDGDFLSRTVSRETAVMLQTPHVYRREILTEAYRRAQREDWPSGCTATIVHRAGYRLRLVRGEPDNLKITYPEDWALAQKKVQPGKEK